MELTWALDYCLACDKQTQGETYCSQSCRLADLETSSTWSGPTSPITYASSASTNKGSGYYLSPRIDFSSYKSANPSSSTATSQSPSPSSSYFPNHSPGKAPTTKPGLTTSSSNTSLTSTQSSSQPTPLSEQSRSELLDYTNSFDNVREWKRRMTWS